jgi:hypothetical protein
MKKPISIRVTERAGERVVVATYADGGERRTPVDPSQKPRRKPRKPYARARAEPLDRTRKKRF